MCFIEKQADLGEQNWNSFEEMRKYGGSNITG